MTDIPPTNYVFVLADAKSDARMIHQRLDTIRVLIDALDQAVLNMPEPDAGYIARHTSKALRRCTEALAEIRAVKEWV